MKPYIKDQLAASIEVKQAILKNEGLIDTIAQVAMTCVQAYKRGRKLMIGGNGGSAADAQHIAGEMVSRFYFDRPGLPAIALTTDTSILTSIGNDYGYDLLFARQVQAQGVEGDVFIGISTSGNSPNVLKAFEACEQKGITRIGLTGEGGGKMVSACEYCIRVPSKVTPRIQEAHITLGHILCAIIEEAMFGKTPERFGG